MSRPLLANNNPESEPVLPVPQLLLFRFQYRLLNFQVLYRSDCNLMLFLYLRILGMVICYKLGTKNYSNL